MLLLVEHTEAVYDEWRRLVVAHSVSGIQVHDARLVAAMRVHRIKHILTLNTQDFGRYPDITFVHRFAGQRMNTALDLWPAIYAHP